MRLFLIRIKRGPVLVREFEVMAESSASAASQHLCLLKDGEYLSVQPLKVAA